MSLDCVINRHVVSTALTVTPRPALKSDLLKAFTHPLCFHFLQLDPHHFVLLPQSLNLSDFPSGIL
jgi:hypothetical protein